MAFGSLLIPVRSILSLGVTFAVSFGGAILIYQRSILDFTGLVYFSNQGAFYWIAPVIAATVVIGIGLDYDIFLLTRIAEYRAKGFTEEASIVRGVTNTGSIITAAGLIMGIAFSGLFFCDTPVLFQMSFIMVVAVLLDTFFVRVFLVPSVMLLFSRVFTCGNFWPRSRNWPKPKRV